MTADVATRDLHARAGRDYTATTAALTFEPFETEKTVSVALIGDDAYEIHEEFELVLSNIANAVLPAGATEIVANATILNDDSRPEPYLIQLTLEGDFVEFDQQKFVNDLAEVLEIEAGRIEIVSTAAGSVIVVFDITEGKKKKMMMNEYRSNDES